MTAGAALAQEPPAAPAVRYFYDRIDYPPAKFPDNQIQRWYDIKKCPPEPLFQKASIGSSGIFPSVLTLNCKL
jgi:hypothetical protein